MMELLDVCMEEATILMEHSVKVLEIFDRALLDAQTAFKAKSDLAEGRNNSSSPSDFTVKPHAHIRLTNLPICPDLHRHVVPRSVDIGSLIMMSGTIVRSGEIKMEERYKVYECQKCCGFFRVYGDDSFSNEIPKPTICMVKGTGGEESSPSCTGTVFNLLKPKSHSDLFKTVQEVRLQEHISKLAVGRVS
jgi:DNA helicase MCM9